MNKTSIKAIERIIACLNEIRILTRGRDDKYFYDSYETPVVCDLFNEIDNNMQKISSSIKQKYNNVNWNIIDSCKHYDFEDFQSLKLRDVMSLAFGGLYNELYDSLNTILEENIREYYKKYSLRMHRMSLKKKSG